jgi:3-oxoacyl-[acyl-carrier-protein] synthase III
MERSAYITGWGVCLPNAPVDNAHIEAVLGPLMPQSATVKRRVLMNNGIATRHYAIDPATGEVTHTNAGMTAEAIRSLCRNADLPESAIESLVCGTSSADQIIPSHASMVHAELGCPPCEATYISGVCCSGVTALKYGVLNVVAGGAGNAVVTGSELASPSLRASHFEPQVRQKTDEGDDQSLLPFSNEFLRWMLSDGAGALLVTAAPRADGPSLRVDWIDMVSYANESDVCMYFGLEKHKEGKVESYRTVNDAERLFRDGFLSLSQDVRVLNDRLPVLMKTAFLRMMSRHDLTPDAVDWLLPHYSSQWFRHRLFDGLTEIGFAIPEERWFTNLSSKGNTGSAAIYIMLEELMTSGKVQPGQRILCMVPESSRMLFGFVHLTAV